MTRPKFDGQIRREIRASEHPKLAIALLRGHRRDHDARAQYDELRKRKSIIQEQAAINAMKERT